MIEELKSRMKSVNAPEMKEKEPIPMESILDEVKVQDEKDKKMFKGTFVLFIIMFVIYTLIFVINPDPELTIMNRMAGGFFILSFGIMIPLLQQNYYERKGVDYQSSTMEFLKKAEGRLKFWNKKSWWVLPFLVFISIAENLALYESHWLASFSSSGRFLIINITYWSCMVAGFFFARMKWRKKKAPLLRQVRKLKLEFD